MVCKTMHSSSILLGTSNLLVISFSVINYVVSRGAPREWRNLFFYTRIFYAPNFFSSSYTLQTGNPIIV